MAAVMAWNYKTCLENNPSVKPSDISDLRKWIMGSDTSGSVPTDVSDQLLLCFHIACNLILEDTKKCIKTYYSIRDKSPEHFDDRDMSLPIMMESSQAVEYCILPERSPEGMPIIYHGLFDTNPEKLNFDPCLKIFLMTIDSFIYEHGPVHGIIMLLDMKGAKLGHLTRVNLISVSKYMTYIQEGMPLKINKILIMNTIPFFDKVMALMKPFMKKELLSLLNIYQPTTDMEVFYRDVLPKRCLPSNYGGDLPDTATLNKINLEKLTALKPFFEAEEKHRYVYTKKSKKKDKLAKGFQDLNID